MMSPSDDLPAGVHAAYSAAAWALRVERSQEDYRFDEIVRAVEAGLYKWALSHARRLLKGPHLVDAKDAEDAVSVALEKVLKDYDPSRGAIKPYLYKVLRNGCTDMLRRNGRELLTTAEPDWWNERPQVEAFSGATAVEDEDMCDRIAAALEVLNLSDTQRGELGRAMDLLDGAEADQFDHLTGLQKKRAMANARQQKKRAGDKVLDEAGVTAEERTAARLVRAHQDLDKAKAAAPGLDVVGLSKSAERKVLRLFNIDTEDDNDGHA
jgi:DNA-directed RNA polymerase specialized sigma24 family protein